MRTVGFIPSRLNSQRLPSKNIKELGGVPLVNYTVRALNKVSDIDEVVIFASEPSICEHIQPGLKYKFLKRPDTLDDQNTTIQDLIREFLKLDSADTVVLLHITSPFLKPETIVDCLGRVNSDEYDSSFTAYAINKFCWFNGKPLNYSLDKPTPRTQDIDPVVAEQSSLYVFKREVFEKTGQRISTRPYVKNINHFEGHDIDTPEDFKIAELIVDTGLFAV
ncbi:MAG: acylneuraminate cytidylyltransferase family protein [Candidatus Omnitrophica bacterium]|nr:acylneuraminate cytidylyltransferase family protein [Candidatus Omnitrophota bacterium]